MLVAGDKPELIYSEAKQELQAMGFESTLEYVAGQFDFANQVMGQHRIAQEIAKHSRFLVLTQAKLGV